MLPFITLLLSVKRNRWVVLAPVGKRLATLKTLIDNPYTPWHTVLVKDWYGHGDYTLQITSHTAVWYHTGLPAVPIRWVLLKDPKGQFQPQALLCTDTSAQPIQILHWFRYSLATRSHLRWKFERTWGLNRARQWSPVSILRTTPALLRLFSIVVMLAHQEQIQHPFDLPNAAWYHKSLPSFSDALAQILQHSR